MDVPKRTAHDPLFSSAFLSGRYRIVSWLSKQLWIRLACCPAIPRPRVPASGALRETRPVAENNLSWATQFGE